VDQEGGIVAYPTYPAASAPSPRPTTVTVSTYLLWVTAAISLITGLLTISTIGDTIDVYGDLYEGTAAEGTEGFLVGASVLAVVINLLFAAGLAILGIFNNRGRNGARITTWVLGGIALCCNGFGLAGTALTNSMDFGSSTTTGAAAGPSPDEVQAALDRALPSWYQPVSTILSVITLLCILAAVILLALPASNAFFRKPAAGGWDPGQQMPYPGQPGHPQPGYPQPGQTPPGQPAQQPGYPTYPPPGSGGLPPYPGQSPQAPPSSSSDPWSQPPADDKRPPSDPS
jgi:hypothetical protein